MVGSLNPGMRAGGATVCVSVATPGLGYLLKEGEVYNGNVSLIGELRS